MTNYYYYTHPNHTGWICPRCGKVNAPWVSQCTCKSNWYKPLPYYPWEFDGPYIYDGPPVSVTYSNTTCEGVGSWSDDTIKSRII